jgi:ApbE superfamily uncharacterized protein (UPF0280 family)
MTGPQIARLADGRLHLNHGPIDLIIDAEGSDEERELAFAQAARRFETVLEGLVAELASLRQPSGRIPRSFRDAIAQAMENATCRHAGTFVTPMAAVAGAVADAVLQSLLERRKLKRAHVNNGGDIALFLAPGRRLSVAIAGTGRGLADRIILHDTDGVRGIASSGWRGRSFSLGIADTVTVLARTAAEADVAATLIANAVDLPGHPAIGRVPAASLAPDSDLGDRLVTRAVGPLTSQEVQAALGRGLAVADRMCADGLIAAAALFLRDKVRLAGVMSRLAAA